MQELQKVDAPLTPEEIIERWGKQNGPLDDLFTAAREPQFELERTVQIRKARYNWKMVKGDQFAVPGFTSDNNGQEIIDFVNDASDTEENGAAVATIFPLNVLWADCSKFIAVMGQSAPRVKAVSDDPDDNEQLQMAHDADAVMRDAWTKLRTDAKWRWLAFHQFTTGPTYIHTPFVVDREKYGESTEPKMELQDQTQPDGSVIQVPVEAGVEVYPNGDVELNIRNVLEVSHPFAAKDIEECGWFQLEYMENKFKLLNSFSSLDQFRDSEPPDDEFGAAGIAAAEAKSSLSNPSGIGRPRQSTDWRFRQLWVRPWQLQAIKDKAARETMQRQYPEGLWIAKVGSVTVGLDARPMSDEWAICKTGRGERIMEDPIANDVVPVQRAINDLANLAVETVLRAIAKTVVDQMLFDRRSLSTNQAVPAEVIFTTAQGVGDISKMMAQIPPSRVSDQLKPLLEFLRAQMQDIDGIRPELSGGGAPTQTYREAKQRKEQALAQLGPQAQEMQWAAELVGRNMVRQRAKYGTGQVKSSRKTAFGVKTDVVDLASLSHSGWNVQADDNFPMTIADTSDKLWGLLKEFPPEVQQALSLLDPLNLERNLQLLQLPGYESAYEDQKRKTLDDVKQLLQSQVIEGAPGPDGQPGPPQPSIQPDQYDDHQFVSTFLPKWMVSREGQEEKNRNPKGFENVMAFQQAQFQMAQPPQPPNAPPARAAINISGSPQEFGLEVVNEVLQGASLPGNVQSLPVPEPKPAPEGEMGAPEPVDGAKPDQESPIGPIDDAPQGPSQPMVQ